jgi:hypothetical protein
LGKVRVWGPLGSSAFRYDVRPRGDVVDPLEASKSDLLMFVMLGAYKEFSEHPPLLSGCIPYVRFVIVIVGFDLTIPYF